MPRAHDMAGVHEGPVEQSHHPRSAFDKRANALLRLLMHPRNEVIFVDEMRRAIEDLGAETYFKLSYYERWVAAARELLVERGVLTEEEIAARIKKIQEELKHSGHS